MSRGALFAALVGPVLVNASIVGLIVDAVMFDGPNELFVFAVALLWVVGLIVRRPINRRRVRPLLADPPSAPDGSSKGDPSPSSELIDALRSRRLVLLCGERGSGRARLALAALRREFGDYEILRPASIRHSGELALVKLLSSSALSLRRRYVLWVDDLGRLLDAGLDTRVIERWLAGGGRARVALATITPTELARATDSRETAAVALERAHVIRIDDVLGPVAAAQVERRYRAAHRDRRPAADAMRLVALCRLLGVDRGLLPTDAVRLVHAAGLEPPDESDLDWACAGDGAPLRIDGDGRLEPDRQLLRLVESENRGAIRPDYIGALLETLRQDASGLLSVGLALAARGQYAEAETLYERAAAVAVDTLKPSILSAQTRLIELRQGASGASLLHRGGLDYDEPMGPAQRAFADKRLPRAPDGDFDPRSPIERDTRLTRFYRHTVRRAAARIGVLMLVDVAAIVIAAVAALAIRADARDTPVRVIDPDFAALAAPALAVTIVVGIFLGLYRSGATRGSLPQIFATMTIVAVVTAAGVLVAGVDLGSVSALVTLYVTAVGVDWGLRAACDAVTARLVVRYDFQTRVLLLGSQDEARRWARQLGKLEGRPAQIVAYLAPAPERGDPFAIGSYAELESSLRHLHIAALVIVDRTLGADERATLVSLAHGLGVDVHFAATELEISTGAIGRVADNGLARAPAALVSPEALELKRIFDRVVLTLTLGAWGTLLALLAAHSAVRRPGQPIFVATERVGLGGSGFAMLRLRTRTVLADGDRGTKATGDIEQFLEDYGIDELPQVINVLRGEMSLVGPRPQTLADVRFLSRDARRILGVRPGLTGRWQVTWSYAPSQEELRAVEIDYLRRWRLSHDFEILLRTPGAIIHRRHAWNDTRLEQQRAGMGGARRREGR